MCIGVVKSTRAAMLWTRVCAACALTCALLVSSASVGDWQPVDSVNLTMNLYRELAARSADGNVLFSPVGVSAVMAIIRLGAKGNTASQIDHVFQFSQAERGSSRSALGEIHAQISKPISHNVTMKVSNRLFVDESIKVLEDYRNALRVYNTELQQLNFASPESAIAAVNRWAGDGTSRLVDDVGADPGRLVAAGVAEWTRADWHARFNPAHTNDREFLVAPFRSVTTPMMFQRGKFRMAHIAPLGLQVLELPLVRKRLRMLILSTDHFELDVVERKLSSETLNSWVSQLQYESVDVALPKFKLEATYDLEQILPKLGITDVFDSAQSDLSGISKDKLNVGGVIHKAAIEVEERGGEPEAERSAAHATSHSLLQVAYLDHPFIFLLIDGGGGGGGGHVSAIHLMGALKRPRGDVHTVHHDEL